MVLRNRGDLRDAIHSRRRRENKAANAISAKNFQHRGTPGHVYVEEGAGIRHRLRNECFRRKMKNSVKRLLGDDPGQSLFVTDINHVKRSVLRHAISVAGSEIVYYF